MSKVVSVNLHHSHSQTLAGILLSEIQDLYSELETVLENVSQSLVIYEKFSENIFQALIGNRNVKLYFTVDSDEILVLFFLNCRQNPDRLDFLK